MRSKTSLSTARSIQSPIQKNRHSRFSVDTKFATMHFYTSIPALLSLVLSVTALPCDQTILTDSPDTNTTKTSEHVFINLTANGGLYLCENAGFRGYCVHYTEPYGRCSKQPHGYHIVDIPAKNKDKLPSQISSHLEIGEFPPQVLTAAVGVPSTRMSPLCPTCHRY